MHVPTSYIYRVNFPQQVRNLRMYKNTIGSKIKIDHALKQEVQGKFTPTG